MNAARLLATLLWKEWRDHRAALIGYFVAIPPLIAWGLAPLNAATRRDPTLPTMAAIGGFLIAALTLFGDLFAGEEQRGTIKLLRRLPCGLSKVFVGKLAFSLLAALAMSGWAYLATTSATALLHGGPWLPKLELLPLFKTLPLFLPVAAWIAAAAIWLSRATLALPAAALTIAVFSAPIVLAVWFNPGLKPMPRELLFAAPAVTVAGIVVAGLSFVLGRRRTSSALAPACVGLLATFACFTPAYAWTGARVVQFLRLEPALASFRIDPRGGALDPSGRYAYVNAFHAWDERDLVGHESCDPEQGDSPLHSLRVDLADGGVRELGPPGSTLSGFGASAIGRNVTPVACLFLSSTCESLPKGDSGIRLFDAATGEPLADDLAKELRTCVGPRAGALGRIGDSVRLPDGRRVWRQDGVLMADPGRVLPDSRFERSPSLHGFGDRGHGVCLGDAKLGSALSREWAWYDLTREQRFAVDGNLLVQFVRAGRWIVRDWTNSWDRTTLKFYDPETRALEPVPSLGKWDDVLALNDDGRVLVVTKAGKESDARRDFVLLDPETGEREMVELPAGIAATSKWIRVAGRTPDGRAIVWLQDPKDRRTWLLRFDPGASGAARAAPRLVSTAMLDGAELLGAADEDSLVAIESSRRLVRARFDGSTVETLFPRTNTEVSR